ncbi:MAG TPA: CsgG/HfaB family protein [Acidobacteriaceae bacterium]|nr:CsgG/HfaB family protein [Acidobacteriaceae bacterium]
MKKVLAAMIVCAFAWTSGLWAQNAAPAQTQGRKIRIAVMDFDYHTVQTNASAIFGTNVDVGQGIADLLVDDLVKNGMYSVIERQQIDKILTEQNFSNSNRADPASAAKIGKMLGVDAIIVGSVTEFGNETKNVGVGGGGWNWHGVGAGGFGHHKSKAIVGVTARIVNIDTGEILASEDGKGESSRSSTSMGGFGGGWGGGGGGHVNFGSSDFQQTIIGEAVKAATDQLATGLEGDASKVTVRTISVNGVVAAVVNGQVVLNVGSGAGLHVGDKLTIERATMTIKDPTTGKVIRQMTSPIGEVQATSVDAVSAVCNILSGSDFKVGDLAQTTTQ